MRNRQKKHASPQRRFCHRATSKKGASDTQRTHLSKVCQLRKRTAAVHSGSVMCKKSLRSNGNIAKEITSKRSQKEKGPDEVAKRRSVRSKQSPPVCLGDQHGTNNVNSSSKKLTPESELLQPKHDITSADSSGHFSAAVCPETSVSVEQQHKDDDLVCEGVSIPDDEVIFVDSDDSISNEFAEARLQHEKLVKEMKSCIFDLKKQLNSMKREYEMKLQMQEIQLQCLQNELKWKDEQLKTMNKLASLNVELESRINLMLSDKKEYEIECEKAKQKKEKEQREDEEQKNEDTVEQQTKNNKLIQTITEVKKHTRKRKDEGTASKSRKSHRQRESASDYGKDEGAASKSSKSHRERESACDDGKDEATASKSRKSHRQRESASYYGKDEGTTSKSRKSHRQRESASDYGKDEGTASKSRKSHRQRESVSDCGKDEIDAYFVDDDSDAEVVKEENAPEGDRKTESGNLKAETVPHIDEGTAADNEDQSNTTRSRHNIRKLMTSTKLQGETKQAAKEEKERIERAKEQHNRHLRVVEIKKNGKEPVTKQLVLAFEEDNKTPLVEVNPKLIRKLKPHQVDAVEFVWDNIIESVERLKNNAEGSGCILAHCMGLGKTLSAITVIHTLLTVKCIGFKYCLIVCPLNTVLNWQYEWEKWLEKKDRIKVYELASCKHSRQRNECLQEWRKTGGVMITGYQLFRILTSYSRRSKKTKEIIEQALIDPGPDVVICDEGHILKNDTSALSKCMRRIRTKRRIVLTGTPLQNNLIEYHCMVNFVKPNLLGSRREFNNRFVNPITNGQHSDSTPFDVKLMKRRAHILHSMLDGCVQRKDYSALTKFLPPKYEYVLAIRLSSLQIELYQKYLELFQPEANHLQSQSGGNTDRERFKIKGNGLFTDYQNLMRIWTHPWLLKLDEARQEKKPYTEYDDELESVLFTSSSEDEIDDDTQLSSVSDSMVKMLSSSTTTSSSSSDDDNDNDEPVINQKKHKKVPTAERNSSKDTIKEQVLLQDKKKHNLEVGRRTRHQCHSLDKTEKVKPSNVRPRKRKPSESESDGDKVNVKTKACSSQTKKNKQSESSDCSSQIKKNAEKPENGQIINRAQIVAGEVIKQWQTNSRRIGTEEEVITKKESSWWTSYVTDDMKTQIELSGKLVIMFEIIRMAELVDDKVLLFSQSILTLDLIEEFLALKDEEAQKVRNKKQVSRWVKDQDYCRMDGTTGVNNRKKLTCSFNSIKNKRMRLFLISTKAGGLGINLDSANRVIIFNASWNPSHDIQAIFRVYRFGQEKPVFVYRLLAQGTMEEKIYERQVTKETLSQRVIDERQIERHFTSNDLQELYHFKPDRLDDPNCQKRPTPAVPKDLILAELLTSKKEWIVQYHEHDSLLENRPDEELSEEERKNAWDEYEREKKGLGTLYRTIPPPNIYKNSMENKSSLTVQTAQMPRVVQEIIKYNPSITSIELNRRLQTFVGMNSSYSSVPAYALGSQSVQTGNVIKNVASTSQVINLNQHIPSTTTAAPNIPSTQSVHTLTPSLILPSRLPLPGPVPANRH